MRGEIRYRKRAKQLRDFSGLRFGKITPTDIDGYLEFQDTLFIWIEAKLAGINLPYGQRLALERMCDAIHGTKNKKEKERVAFVLVIEHDTPADQDVNYADARVISIRHEGKWKKQPNGLTCRRAIEKLRELAKIR